MGVGQGGLVRWNWGKLRFLCMKDWDQGIERHSEAESMEKMGVCVASLGRSRRCGSWRL